MESFTQDIRYGLRSLAQKPGFTAITVLTLALGIGANTAIFSVVNAVLLRDMPYEEPERIVVVWESNPKSGKDRNVVGPANYLTWRDEATSFEELAGLYTTRINLTGVPDPEEIIYQAVTPNFFPLLGAQPMLGRALEEADAAENAPDVIVLSHGFWQRRMGGDPAVLGKTIHLNGIPQTVVGVMPPEFQLTLTEGQLAAGRAELWSPLQFTAASRTPRGRSMTVVGRLKPGVTPMQAQEEVAAIGQRTFPDWNKGRSATVVPLREQMVGSVRTPLLILLGAVGFVLLIACANVANLLLMRAAARQKEIAIRAALGAGRWRVVRQLLTESVMLSAIGGLFGLAIAFWGVDLLLAMRPADMILLSGIGIDYRVLGFTLGVSVLTGLVFGIAPALQASKADVNGALKEGGKGASGERASHRLRDLFVVSEVALALVLLIGAGLLIRSFATLRAVDPGFDAENLLTVKLQLSGQKYPEEHQRVAFFRQALERAEAQPGVRSASAISYLPFAGLGAATGFTIEGREAPTGADRPTCDVSVVGADFFETMGIPFVAGRDFKPEEFVERRNVVIVGEALAREHFPGEDPLGKRITIAMRDPESPCEIVGVVKDVRRAGLDVEPRPAVYWAHPELAYGAMTLVARTEGDPLSVVPAIHREIRAMDADVPLADVRPMTGWLAESTSKARFSTLLLAVFAGVAFVLSVVGIYGVLAYSVTQRSQEIAIRSALGAQRGDILTMIVRQGMLLAAVGIGIGIAATLGLNRLISGLLYGVSATDAVTYTGISLLFLAVALLACLVPARRATRVHPASALR